jgi:D-cysteine desulfhydrase
MAELMEQLNAARMRVDAIVVASSSGGTQAGLIAGAIMHEFLGTIIGVSIDKLVHALACQTLSLAGAGSAVPLEMVRIREEYLGGGYGVVGPMERDAIRLCARTEGILLDPVYTARAMGGLIDMITQKQFQSGDTILFWHTGGAPSLFAYAHDLS